MLSTPPQSFIFYAKSQMALMARLKSENFAFIGSNLTRDYIHLIK